MSYTKPGAWMDSANCATTDPEIFFPEKGPSNAAKQVCAACDVVAQCLAFARREGIESGIFGGMTAHERKTARKAA